MSLEKIKKRYGSIADFDPQRITTAIQKAADSLPEELKVADFSAENITEQVLDHLKTDFSAEETFPTVEDIQDVVERVLVEAGYFEIAKRYILYRAERARVRAEARLEQLQKLEKNQLKITHSDGKKSTFQLAKVRQVLERCAEKFSAVDTNLVLEEVKRNIYDGITTAEVSQVLILAGKSFIERDPQYSQFTAALLLNTTYREVFGVSIETTEDLHREYQAKFRNNLEKGVQARRLSDQLLTFDHQKLSQALDPQRDQLLHYLGAQTLYDRYFVHIGGQRIEAPQQFWMRVSMGLALAEKESERDDAAIRFYDQLSNLNFINSTPTLFNAGTPHSQLSSCYLSTIEDNLTHIMKVIGDNAQLSKWAGGIGNDWTNIRATGANIHGTNGKSQGVIPFLKIANDTALAVNQGGKRKGAVVAYLESWHYDIEEFLELRKNTGDERRRTHDMNTANWVPDLLLERVEQDGDWSLFSPDEVPELHHTYGQEFRQKYEAAEAAAEVGKIKIHKKIPARQLWKKMITMLFETGHPWITFKDPCNVRSPQDHVGVVHNSNLCTEITLNNSAEETAVCNLGSINLARHFDASTKAVDWDKLAKTVQVAMRMLDNVIDINFYPTKETKNSNQKHRPVGLGIMGWHDLLFQLDLGFDTSAAVDLSDQVMEFISYHSIQSSVKLAEQRGAYESYHGSKWDRGLFPIDTLKLLERERGKTLKVSAENSRLNWDSLRAEMKQHGMRNSNCMAIAPTATIANIAGCIPCTEPIYKNLYVKSNMGGEFMVINRYLVEDLKALGLWNPEQCQRLKSYDGSVQSLTDLPIELREKYKEVFEIDSQWIIKHAAQRQKWIDQAQSTNIFYRGTSGKEISDIYLLAWEYGLKTTYYLRTVGATQIQKATVNISDQKLSQHQKPATNLSAETECEACQ